MQKIKQPINPVNERELLPLGIQVKNLLNSGVEEENKSHHLSDHSSVNHNSINLQDKNNEIIEVSKSEDEDQGNNGLTEKITT